MVNYHKRVWKCHRLAKCPRSQPGGSVKPGLTATHCGSVHRKEGKVLSPGDGTASHSAHGLGGDPTTQRLRGCTTVNKLYLSCFHSPVLQLSLFHLRLLQSPQNPPHTHTHLLVFSLPMAPQLGLRCHANKSWFLQA